jgi:hypothetical protein
MPPESFLLPLEGFQVRGLATQGLGGPPVQIGMVLYRDYFKWVYNDRVGEYIYPY